MKLRIVEWDRHFENAASRKLKRLDWVAIKNKTDGEGYTALVDHPNGAAHLGAWLAIVEAASKQDIRGMLPTGITGGIAKALCRVSRLREEVFDEVIPRLLEIGWIEDLDIATGLSTPNCEEISQSRAARAKANDSPNPPALFLTAKNSHKNQTLAFEVAESADVVAESADVVAESARHIEGNRREGKGIEGKGIESSSVASKVNPRRPDDDDSKLQSVREMIRDYPFAKSLAGEPDDDIARQCLESTRGNPDLVAAALKEMWKSKKEPQRSWGWFPKVIGQYFRREA